MNLFIYCYLRVERLHSIEGRRVTHARTKPRAYTGNFIVTWLCTLLSKIVVLLSVDMSERATETEIERKSEEENF